MNECDADDEEKEEGGDYQEVRPGDKIAAEALGEDEKGGG